MNMGLEPNFSSKHYFCKFHFLSRSSQKHLQIQIPLKSRKKKASAETQTQAPTQAREKKVAQLSILSLSHSRLFNFFLSVNYLPAPMAIYVQRALVT